MKTILITGGTGFIGSHIVAILLEKGYEVIILDSLINSSKKVIEKIKRLLNNLKPNSQINLKFYQGDILDSNILHDVFFEAASSNKPIDAVIHLAGLKSVEESVSNPLEYWETNINSTLNLLSVMDKYKCYKSKR